YAAYLLPGLIGAVGWHYFWCQAPEAAYTKVTGVALFFACASAFLSVVFDNPAIAEPGFRAGGSLGGGLAGLLDSGLSRIGSLIVLLTLMMLAVILATQFSFGQMFAWVSRGSRDG